MHTYMYVCACIDACVSTCVSVYACVWLGTLVLILNMRVCESVISACLFCIIICLRVLYDKKKTYHYNNDCPPQIIIWNNVQKLIAILAYKGPGFFLFAKMHCLYFRRSLAILLNFAQIAIIGNKWSMNNIHLINHYILRERRKKVFLSIRTK